MVGMKVIVMLFIGYFNVFQYVKFCVQGVDLIQMIDKIVFWVMIIYYFDVCCLLMIQKVYVEGLCVFYFYIVIFQDVVVVEVVYGVDVKLVVKVNDLMLLVVKGVGFEQVYVKFIESL